MKKTKDFAQMATRGRSVFGPLATMRVRRIDSSPEPADSRIGFIISTKIFKRAVKRNLAKRRFRGAVRELLDQIPKGYHLLFVLKPDTLTADYQVIKDEILRLVSKIPETMSKPLKLSPRARKEMSRGKIAAGARFVKPRVKAKKVGKDT